MHSTLPREVPAGFQQELLVTYKDPQVRHLALRWASALDLAEDALQTAYYKVATVKHPERIANLRAYYLRVLRNEVGAQRVHQRAVPYESPEDALNVVRLSITASGPAPARPIDETVCTSLQAQSWLKRLAAQRDCLLAAIPARSDDPTCYRAVIYVAAEQVLRDGINGEPSDADSNDAFRKAFRDYFHQPGAAPNTLHQRFRRAREDVKAILRAIVSRGELS